MTITETQAKQLAYSIHSRRMEKFLSIDEACSQIGVTPSTYNRLVNGHYNANFKPSGITVRKFTAWLAT